MNSPRAVSPDDVADALAVLRAATRWSLTSARWAEVEKAGTAVLRALAIDDGPGLRAGISGITLLGPVRQATRSLTAPAPDEMLGELAALIGVLAELESAGGPRQPEADAGAFPVSIYLRDGSGHEQVERAVEELARAAGLSIIERDDPVLASWFRRMRAALTAAARSPVAQDMLLDGMHRAELELVLRPDAQVTALLMANLAPLITSLQYTKDAVIRLGAVLVVKCDWTLSVHQLTTRQQFVLDHAPHLVAAPDKILQALGLPESEAAALPAESS